MFPNDSKNRIDLAIDISWQKPNSSIYCKLPLSRIIVFRDYFKAYL